MPRPQISWAADSADVRAVKIALNRLGYYLPSKTIGMNDLPDRSMFTAIKGFQRARNPRASGEIRPDDTTLAAMNAATADQENSGDSYSWQGVGDQRVRHGVAALYVTTRRWADEFKIKKPRLWAGFNNWFISQT